MTMFRAKKLDLGCFVNVKVIRDHTKRKVFAEHEAERQALRYVIRNLSIPPMIRVQAQLQLAQMHSYTRSTQIRNRCLLGGKGRGVMTDFRLSRVREPFLLTNAKMFRRLESGLPEDPKFPADIKQLSYFVNEKDEIRNIKNPKAYFQYFLTKNDRVNDLHREAMNGAIRNIVVERLNNLGLEIIRLPLGAKATERNIPIFVSEEIKSKKRVLVLFYDEQQDLGVFSQRILLGKGGINQGSAINLVKYVQSMHSSLSTDVDDSPAIILANSGQLRWWRRGKKAVSQMSWYTLPTNSLVDPPYEFNPEKNTVPGNRNIAEHVEYVFNHVITELTNPDSKLEIIGVSGGAVEVSVFLEKDENWKKWKPRLSAFASIASYYSPNEITNEDFRKWLIDRGRAYIISPEPCGFFLAGPDGSEEISPRGLPTFSLGEPFYIENMLPVGFKAVIDWFEEVANDFSYVNPTFFRLEEKNEDKDTITTQPCS